MSAPIPLRRDFGASQLRGLAKKTKDGPQARRLLALAAIYDGATRTEAAMIGGVGLQIIRDWVLHFNERGPDGLLNGKSPGQPSKLNDVQRQAIARMIESGPIPAVHGVVRWRLIDLAQWIFEEFRIAIAKQTLSRELRAMGYRKLSARPRHYAQAAGATHTPYSWSIRPAGTCRRDSSCHQTSPLWRCRRNVPSSIRSKTSGSSCVTTGCRTASSNLTTISSTTAVWRGTSSSISPGESCPSDCANGRTGSDQWDSV